MARISAPTPKPFALLPVGAAALTLGLVAATSQASFIDSFEDFADGSGSTVNGWGGDSNNGSWDASLTPNESTVMVGETDAYDGSNYLRINDQGTSQVHQILTLDTPMDLSDSVNLSYALRWSPVAGGNPWLLFNPRVTDGDNIALLGNQWNEYAHDFDNLDQGTWYVFDQVVTLDDPDSADPQFNIALTVTNAETNAIVLEDESYFSWTVDEGFTSFAGFRMFTGGSAVGVIDIDAISIVPEPASLLLLGVGGLLIAARRRGA